MYKLPPKRNNPCWPMPADYSKRSDAGKREARLELLTGWWDEDRMGILITDHKIFTAAFFYYVDFYVKRSKSLRAYYYRKNDCIHKRSFIEDMGRRRFLTIAPRGSGKTFTLIYEMCPFIAQFRPQTEILVCGENWDMTSEKLVNVMERVENNELLDLDFGRCYPTRGKGKKWSSKRLMFNNGSSIGGSSIDAATRGRHPLLGLIDDAEGKKARKSAQWRKDFMKWVSADFVNQFDDHGAVVGWIGTILNSQSCLNQAFHDMDPDGRYRNWGKRLMKMVYRDDNGVEVSAWPEKLTVQEFHSKMRHDESGEDRDVTVIGAAAVMAEFQGEPIPDGERMFIRDDRRNGYLIYKDQDGRVWMYDPMTQESVDYHAWIETLYTNSGLDIADTETSSADYTAMVVGGINNAGTIFVLDAWQDRIWSDKASKRAFVTNDKWKCVSSGWEKGVLGNRVIREGMKLRKEYRAQDRHVARLVKLTTSNIPKPDRIERMQAAWERGDLRVPIITEIDGLKSMPLENAVHIHMLIEQFDIMTNEGTGGADDLIDACEMMHRTTLSRPLKSVKPNTDHVVLEKFRRDLGIEFSPSVLQPQSWTEDMHRQIAHGEGPPVQDYLRYDPYD